MTPRLEAALRAMQEMDQEQIEYLYDLIVESCLDGAEIVAEVLDAAIEAEIVNN